VLPTRTNGVAAPQTGVEQHIAPNSLFGADWPALVVGGSVRFGPHRETWSFFTLWVIDTFGRIDGDVFGPFGPPKEPTHCVNKIPRLRRRGSAAITSGDYDGLSDSADRPTPISRSICSSRLGVCSNDGF
jgi:hypothetical protein